MKPNTLQIGDYVVYKWTTDLERNYDIFIVSKFGKRKNRFYGTNILSKSVRYLKIKKFRLAKSEEVAKVIAQRLLK